MKIEFEAGMFSSLLIVGNGFDCSLKANTRYEDFYKLLIKAYEASTFDDFIKSCDEKYRRDDLESFFNLLKEETTINYFINYFISYNKAFDCWVDFESELERIIVSFDQLVTVLKDPNKLEYHGYDLCIRVMDNLNLVSVILNYPKNRFFKAEIYNEQLLFFAIRGVSLDDYKNLYNGINKFIKTFPKELYKDLSSFSRLFSTYLYIIRDDITYNVSHPFCKDCKVVINYNYTDYLGHYYKRKDYKLNDILYVNGKCDFKKHRDKIVFGIDSNVIIKNNEFFIFTKTAQRSAKNTEINRITYIVENYSIKEIFVYGHSLNTADKDTLEYIFKNCRGYSGEKAKITVYCYDNESKLSAIANLKEILGLEYYMDLQTNGNLVLKDI